MWHWVILTKPNNSTAQCHTVLIEETPIKRTRAVRRLCATLPQTLPAQSESWFLLRSVSCLETVTCTAVHGPFFLKIGAGEVWLILYPCTKIHLYVCLINRLCYLPSMSIGTKCTSVCTSHDVSTEFLLSIGEVGMVGVFIPTFIISLTCITYLCI